MAALQSSVYHAQGIIWCLSELANACDLLTSTLHLQMPAPAAWKKAACGQNTYDGWDLRVSGPDQIHRSTGFCDVTLAEFAYLTSQWSGSTPV